MRWGRVPSVEGLFVLAMGLLTCLAAVLPAAGQTPAVLRLSYVQGSVQILEGDRVQFAQAQVNMPLLQGYRLDTGSDGEAEIEFEDGSVARLTPNSSLQVDRRRERSNRALSAELEQLTGLAYYELNVTEGQHFSVRFGSATARPTDNSIFRVNLDNAPDLGVFEGAVHVDGAGTFDVDLHSAESIRLDALEATNYDLADGVAADSWDRWNTDRDQTIAEEAQNQTEGRATSGDGDNPAWNDLDYYGDWYPVEGYGNVWVPADTGQNWDPYAQGEWADYGSEGYLWVSSYPWGWLPYHCGAWNYFNSFGWGWIPGQCGLGWVPMAPIWNMPVGYHPPAKPNPGGHIGQRVIPVNRRGSGGGAVHAEHTRVIHLDGESIRPLPVVRNGNDQDNANLEQGPASGVPPGGVPASGVLSHPNHVGVPVSGVRTGNGYPGHGPAYAGGAGETPRAMRPGSMPPVSVPRPVEMHPPVITPRPMYTPPRPVAVPHYAPPPPPPHIAAPPPSAARPH
jgi:hypothetical protein